MDDNGVLRLITGVAATVFLLCLLGITVIVVLAKLGMLP